MATAALWVMLATYWGDAAISQEFTSYENCQAAGQKIQAATSTRFVFICSQK